MTTEEAIEFIAQSVKSDVDMAKVADAIKALKQEPVLDKIRAEIEEHCGLAKENHCRYCSYCNNLMGVREILEIIDKFKAETENT